MNVVKCTNGHFFDGDTYQTCPHCGSPVANNVYGDAATPTTKKKFSWFSGEKKKTTSSMVSSGAVSSPVVSNGDEATVGMEELSTPNQPSEANDVTVPLFSDDETTVRMDKSHRPKPVMPPAPTPSPIATPEPVVNAPVVAENNDNSLKDMVRKASANEEGKTMSYFTAAAAAKSESTGAAPAAAPSDPVVGWLVCLKGKHFGESFVICSGKNSIGRNENNKIVLFKENSVSREKHALIVYEPKKRNFYLQPGDGSGLTYLNDDYITESKLMASKDIIELGESKFMFVPLCNADFSWEEYV